MFTKEKTPVTRVKVTARQINQVANEIKVLYPVLSQSYADFAVEVATKNRGVISLDADDPLAIEIKNLS